jgi:hypothetical protein
VILSSQIAPRIREIVKGRDQIEFDRLLLQVFEMPVKDLLPIQRAIAEAEMFDLDWKRSNRNQTWKRG